MRHVTWGPKKLIFLIREIDDATMAGASVESCQFVVLGSGVPGVGGIAYAAYAAASRVRYISHGPLRYTSIGHDPPNFDPELSRAPRPAYAASDHPILDLRRASASRSEKVNNLPDGTRSAVPRPPVAAAADRILPQR